MFQVRLMNQGNHSIMMSIDQHMQSLALSRSMLGGEIRWSETAEIVIQVTKNKNH